MFSTTTVAVIIVIGIVVVGTVAYAYLRSRFPAHIRLPQPGDQFPAHSYIPIPGVVMNCKNSCGSYPGFPDLAETDLGTSRGAIDPSDKAMYCCPEGTNFDPHTKMCVVSKP